MSGGYEGLEVIYKSISEWNFVLGHQCHYSIGAVPKVP